MIAWVELAAVFVKLGIINSVEKAIFRIAVADFAADDFCVHLNEHAVLDIIKNGAVGIFDFKSAV